MLDGRWIRQNRPLIDAIGIAILSLVVAALGVSGVWDLFSVLPERVSPWWTLALALPGCVLVLFKRRVPMFALVVAAVLFLIDLVTVGGIGPLLVLLDVLWTVVFLSSPAVRRRILWVLVVAVVAMFAAVLALTDGQMRIAFVVALQVAAIFGTDYWWAVAVAQAHELAELHRRQAEDAARAAQRDRVEAVRDEREAMARELHDLVAGHVLAMAIRSEAALSTPPDEAGDRAALQAVRDAGLQAHQALRSMITVLRESDGELTTPLRLEDVDAMVEDARRSGLRVRVERTVSGEMPVPVAHAVARVVRESLANCIRHAAGAAVQVTITGESDRVRVVVRSHGGSSLSGASLRGGELAGSGWGLTLLAERVKALGGEFIAGPEGDDGWTVRADLPVGVLV